jgi:aminopeptidase
MVDPRLSKLANVIVNYSTSIQPNDNVFVVCDEVAIPWMKAVVEEAVKAGGKVETLLKCQEINEIILKHGSEEQLSMPNHLMEEVMRRADVMLTAWGGRNTKINANIHSERIRKHTLSEASWRKLFSQKMGDGSLRWCGTQFPTFSDAQEANMSLSDYEDFVYNAGHLDKEDPISEWKRISKEQERWLQFLDGKNEIHILSENTDIKIDVRGRKWINCDGKVNFPDGEIFTSPVENGVNGFITFTFPGIYAGKEIEEIRLDVKDGLIEKATAGKGEDLLHALISTDEGSKRFGEVAIGTNYNIKTFTRNMLFDEKIGGTVHMAIGDSMVDAGGLNRSTLHWDMLCDMRQEGRIYADGVLFYEKGQFLESNLT